MSLKGKLVLLLLFFCSFLWGQELTFTISRYKLYKDTTLMREWHSGAATFPTLYLDKKESFQYLRLEIQNKRLDTISELYFTHRFFCNSPNPKDLWGNTSKSLIFEKELFFETLSDCGSKDGVILIQDENEITGAAFHIKIK